jgi:MFS family permease
LIAAVVADLGGWRVALAVIGAVSLAAIVALRDGLQLPGVPADRPPFGLPPALVGLVFLGYLAGSYASTAAGRLGDRVGRRRVLWAAVLVALAGAWVTLPDALPAALVGLLLVTVGFFGAHSLASSWVGRRSSSLRGGAPAVASSLYLLASTPAAASAGRSAAWPTTARAGPGWSAMSARCCWAPARWRWRCAGSPRPDAGRPGHAQTGWVVHRSVRPCQNAPTDVRSYSARLVQGADVVPSVLRTTSCQHRGVAHVPQAGTATGPVMVPPAWKA